VRSRETARRYAGALYEVAVEDGNVAGIEAELAEIVRQLRDVEGLHRFLAHPLMLREKKEALISSAFPDLSPHVANAMRLLIRHRRESYLDLIYDEFLEVRSEAENLARARVVTAAPLSDEERTRLAKRLETALGRPVKLEEERDERLLAGARIEVEGKTIDATLRARIEKLRTVLER
jgi:F-type H+-transporting ATPase subunit delta